MSLSNNERQWKDLSNIEKKPFLNRALYLLEKGYILDNIFFGPEPAASWNREDLDKLAEKIFKNSV